MDASLSWVSREDISHNRTPSLAPGGVNLALVRSNEWAATVAGSSHALVLTFKDSLWRKINAECAVITGSHTHTDAHIYTHILFHAVTLFCIQHQAV